MSTNDDTICHLTTTIAAGHNALDVAGVPRIGGLADRINNLAARTGEIERDLYTFGVKCGTNIPAAVRGIAEEWRRMKDADKPTDYLRLVLRDVLGFRPSIADTVTDAEIVAEAKAVSKRADDAEIEIAKVHALLNERTTTLSTLSTLTLEDRVAVVLDQRNGYWKDLQAARERDPVKTRSPLVDRIHTAAVTALLDGLQATAEQDGVPSVLASIAALRALVVPS